MGLLGSRYHLASSVCVVNCTCRMDPIESGWFRLVVPSSFVGVGSSSVLSSPGFPLVGGCVSSSGYVLGGRGLSRFPCTSMLWLSSGFMVLDVVVWVLVGDGVHLFLFGGCGVF